MSLFPPVDVSFHPPCVSIWRFPCVAIENLYKKAFISTIDYLKMGSLRDVHFLFFQWRSSRSALETSTNSTVFALFAISLNGKPGKIANVEFFRPHRWIGVGRPRWWIGVGRRESPRRIGERLTYACVFGDGLRGKEDDR